MSENKKKVNNKKSRKSVTLTSDILMSLTSFNKDLSNPNIKPKKSNDTLIINKKWN